MPEVINIITAAIIYFSAFALLFKSFLGRLMMKRQRDAEDKAEGIPSTPAPVHNDGGEPPQTPAERGDGK